MKNIFVIINSNFCSWILLDYFTDFTPQFPFTWTEVHIKSQKTNLVNIWLETLFEQSWLSDGRRSVKRSKFQANTALLVRLYGLCFPFSTTQHCWHPSLSVLFCIGVVDLFICVISYIGVVDPSLSVLFCIGVVDPSLSVLFCIGVVDYLGFRRNYSVAKSSHMEALEGIKGFWQVDGVGPFIFNSTNAFSHPSRFFSKRKLTWTSCPKRQLKSSGQGWSQVRRLWYVCTVSHDIL